MKNREEPPLKRTGALSGAMIDALMRGPVVPPECPEPDMDEPEARTLSRREAMEELAPDWQNDENKEDPQ